MNETSWQHYLILESFRGMLNQLVATSLEILDDEIVGL